jgi:hypothetical protein
MVDAGHRHGADFTPFGYAAAMEYELLLEEHAGYVHAIGKGPRTADNARRFLREAGEACVRSGRGALLVEFAFTGPPLDSRNIFAILQDRLRNGMRLRRIAYVESTLDDPAKAHFAETVARNRGVNVKLFESVDAARTWLAQE